MSKSRILLIIGIVGFAGLMLAVCCGGFAFWGWNLFTGQAKTALNMNPVIREHIGEVESLEFDFAATGEAADDDVFMFRVKGPKGSGVVTAEFASSNGESEEIRSGTLQLPSGESFDLLEQRPLVPSAKAAR